MATLLLLLACSAPQDPSEFLDTGEIIDVDQDGVPAMDDCNDLSPSIYPGAPETCDSRDEDCDGNIDEDAGPTWYVDDDDDGYGHVDSTLVACTAPDGHVSNAEDCDDDNAAIYPGAEEVCNESDDDCDDQIDESGEAETFYQDADDDGYGDEAITESGCSAPSGYVSNAEDCDDLDPDVNPAAIGDCSGKDVDCSGWIEFDESPGSTEDCDERSCWELLDTASGPMSDGLYWIDPTVSNNPFQVWCDMSTDGGGYTFLKYDAPGTTYADEAERACNEYGLNLFIPRTENHLASAWAVVNDTAAGGEASADYLYIMGIYPDYGGATCSSQSFSSSNASCAWSARDGKGFWVGDLTTITEPNGDNDTQSSMYYAFDDDGNVTWYNDLRYPGYGSARFVCSRGDK